MPKNNNKKITTIEGLAVLVQNEFLGINEKLDTLGKDVKFLKEEVKALRKEIEAIKATLDNHKLRLDEMAPYFEVRDLDQRLRAVEKKLGIE